MTETEISTLEHAGRTSIAWVPEGYDGQTHYSAVITAIAPALFIVALAAGLLLVLV